MGLWNKLFGGNGYQNRGTIIQAGAVHNYNGVDNGGQPMHQNTHPDGSVTKHESTVIESKGKRTVFNRLGAEALEQDIAHPDVRVPLDDTVENPTVLFDAEHPTTSVHSTFRTPDGSRVTNNVNGHIGGEVRRADDLGDVVINNGRITIQPPRQ